MRCPYCRGTGVEYVEQGSSLCYDCPDCRGTGNIPECEECGEPYYGEYCEKCYDICDECGEVVFKEEIVDGVCIYCTKEKELKGN